MTRVTSGSVLAVVAHPDDESFGLGAVLAALAAVREVRVLCLTHGGASTLGRCLGRMDLGAVRSHELSEAASRLGIADVILEDFPDGGLAKENADALAGVVERALGDAGLVVVFDPRGVTGHSDHKAATSAGRAAAKSHRLPVLEWGVAPAVAYALNRELGASFCGMSGDGAVDVDVAGMPRLSQLAAIRCHASQATGNAVLNRRLELQGDLERVRFMPATPQRSEAPEVV